MAWVAFLLAAAASPAQDRPPDPPAYVPGEVLLTFKSGADPDQAGRVIEELGAAPVKRQGRPSPRLKTIRGLTVEEAVAKYRNDPSPAARGVCARAATRAGWPKRRRA